ncbi:hypothetical protein [Pseudovibrio sp. SPO723]|uniref:hypothetical protein n=1 Tax=Nesiotobacter zosterae TaxID=392721 RepID=UPI0029C4FD5A|nr:hypothetical protein [Pseudovibrio sp. SPO723]MDX5595638.1 hypothetical protein [Pseudovibrio sp. SPO723]
MQAPKFFPGSGFPTSSVIRLAARYREAGVFPRYDPAVLMMALRMPERAPESLLAEARHINRTGRWQKEEEARRKRRKASPKKPSMKARVEKILQQEAAEAGVSVERLRGRCRKRPSLQARREAVARCHEELGLNCKQIGEYFSGRGAEAVRTLLQRAQAARQKQAAEDDVHRLMEMLTEAERKSLKQRALALTIAEEIARKHERTLAEIRARRREPALHGVRREALYWAWERTNLGWSELGQLFGRGAGHVACLVREHAELHGLRAPEGMGRVAA